MSTQLILYPQYYQGFSSINFSANQFVVDGMNFTTMDSSLSFTTSGTLDDHLFTVAPAQINTWYRWRSTLGGTPALPVTSGSNLILNAVAPSSLSGVYMKLANLIVGASYTLTVNMTPQAGFLNLKAFNLTNNSVIVGQIITSNVTQQTLTFIAETTTDTVAILYHNTSATDLTISSISTSPTGQSPTQIYTDLEDGQVICDLYEEEDIPLTLSIDDFKNVAEKVQSYSKDFNLPATKRNNRIFNNMFEVTRSDDGLIFNPYVRTKCVLKQDGFILFEGYLRLIDAKDKKGEISYNVNLYSEVIALADVLKDATFSDLDFSELTNNYNYTEIRNSWQGALGLKNPLPPGTFAGTPGASTTGVLKYPFIDWSGQIGLDTSTPYFPVLPSLESAFRPCIQLKYLINRIFAAAGFTYTSNFFNTTIAGGGSFDFDKLFMDFNWGADNTPVTMDEGGEGHVDTQQTATTSFVTIQTNDNTFTANLGYSSGVYTAVVDNQTYGFDYSYSYDVTNNVPWSGTFRWKMVKGGVTSYIDLQTVTGLGDIVNIFGQQIYGTFSEILNTGDTLTPEFKSTTASTNDFQVNILGTPGGIFGTAGATYANTSATAVTNDIILQTLRGELGQWDFLKGIITMFNLVTMVDESNPDNILIEPYSDVFINNTNGGVGNLTLADRGIQHDWTDKVDVSQMELKPLTELNKNTIFQFVEDEDDYVFRQYKNATSGHLYGSKVWDASGFTILQGTKEIIAEPFAATVSKPLFYQFPDFIVPSIYSMTDDGTGEGFDNSPRIFYSNYVSTPPYVKTLTSCTYFVPNQNGALGNATEDEFLQFSHLTTIPTVTSTPPAATDTADFVFQSDQLFQPIGTPPINNLYNTYWSPYFNELYSPDTRIMKLKVNLTPADVASFKFYDTVFIKNRVFRVNKIEYKPNTLAKVEFILIP
tara:strand:- start:465 stop:3260 length:2796 start_codon:yes stop_codon:yes gene_type:complete